MSIEKDMESANSIMKTTEKLFIQKRVETLNVRINNNKKIIAELEREIISSQAELNKIECDDELYNAVKGE
jgi:hypothetical protein